MATRIWASPERAASLPASSRASPRSPVALVGSIPSRAWRTRPMSAVSLTTIRAVRSAVTTLTRPPVGRSRSASSAAALAASSRLGATSVARHAGGRVEHEDDVAGQAGRSFQERSRGEQGQDRHEQQLKQEQQAAPEPLPRRVGLDVRDERVHSRVDGTTRLIPAQLEQVHRHDHRDEQQAEQREGGREGHGGLSQHAPAAQLVEHQDRPGSCRMRGRRSSPGAWPRDPRSPPSRPPGGPCRRRAWRGRRSRRCRRRSRRRPVAGRPPAPDRAPRATGRGGRSAPNRSPPARG